MPPILKTLPLYRVQNRLEIVKKFDDFFVKNNIINHLTPLSFNPSIISPDFNLSIKQGILN